MATLPKSDNVTFRISNKTLLMQLCEEAEVAGFDSHHKYARQLVEQVMAARDAPDERGPNVEHSQGPELTQELRELRAAIHGSLVAIFGLVPISEEAQRKAKERIDHHFLVEEIL